MSRVTHHGNSPTHVKSAIVPAPILQVCMPELIIILHEGGKQCPPNNLILHVR